MQTSRRSLKKTFMHLPTMGGGNIALVIPSDELRHQLEQLLNEEGHIVKSFTTTEALDDFFSQHPHPAVLLLADELIANQPMRRLRFSYVYTQLLMIGENPTAANVQLAFEAGIYSYLFQPLHPEKIKQSVRRALEIHTIHTFNSELQGYQDFTESLKAISACNDLASLKRLTPDILSRSLNAETAALYVFEKKPKVGLFSDNQSDENHRRWNPISAVGIERQKHMQGAEFLAWFFEKRWRRFNKANVLRGNYRPWEIKSIFGRYPLLVPIRHREGLWGVMVLARTKRGQGFSGEERARAEVFGMHLARTFYILEHYQESNERAFVDQITGLYNQRFFDFYGQHEFFIASQSHAPLSVLAVNVLSFREVNERYGHLAGADLLGQIGKILKRAFRESDIIIRLDGDIFVSLLRNTNLVTAKVVEKRIHQLLADSQLKIKAGITLQPKLTTSIVVFPDDGSDLKNILQLGLDRLNSR